MRASTIFRAYTKVINEIDILNWRIDNLESNARMGVVGGTAKLNAKLARREKQRWAFGEWLTRYLDAAEDYDEQRGTL